MVFTSVCNNLEAVKMKHLKGALLIDQTPCIGRKGSEAWRSIYSESPVSYFWGGLHGNFSGPPMYLDSQSASFQTSASVLQDGPLLCQKPTAWCHSQSGQAAPVSQDPARSWAGPAWLAFHHQQRCVNIHSKEHRDFLSGCSPAQAMFCCQIYVPKFRQ